MLDYRVSRVPQSSLPTTVVIGEYDGWADPPDRPWNVVALANSVLGVLYAHGPAIWDADPAAVPPGNTTVEGNVTRHLVPAANLPLTQPFRDLGVRDGVVDSVDRVLRPVVDAGYVRHDRPGDPRPYLSEGRLRRNPGAEVAPGDGAAGQVGRAGRDARNSARSAGPVSRALRGGRTTLHSGWESAKNVFGTRDQ